MKHLLLFFIVLIPQILFAQNKLIDLKENNKHKQELNFKIKSISDSRKEKIIGIMPLKKSKKVQTFEFKENLENVLENFVSKNFTSNNNDDEILIDIVELNNILENENEKNSLFKFNYACDFYRITNSGKQLLYKFNASNSIRPSSEPKKVLESFIARALNKSIEEFNKSYKTNDGWKNEAQPMNIKMKVNVQKNNILAGDSIACERETNLKIENFNAPVLEDEKDISFSDIHIFYKLTAEEDDKEINLNIDIKGVFKQSKSWAKNQEKGSNWLAHQQNIFEITAIYTNKLFNQTKAKTFSPGTYKMEMNTLYNKLMVEYNKEIDKYLEETNFGENALQITVWATALAAQ